MSKRSTGESTPERNSIYFWDVLKDIVVPIAVCTCAAFIAVQANRIYNLQAMIAKNSESPTIEVTEHSFPDTLERGMEDSVDIAILDGKYNNYESDIITFLICEYNDVDENSQLIPNKTFEIPLVNYYDMRSQSQATYGKVETIYTLQNTTGMRSVRNAAKEKYEEVSGRTFTTSMESYLRITYTNLLDEPEIVYYRLDGSSDGIVARLNKEYGDTQFEKWQGMTQEGLLITPEDSHRTLFKKLNKMDKTFELYKIPKR